MISKHFKQILLRNILIRSWHSLFTWFILLIILSFNVFLIYFIFGLLFGLFLQRQKTTYFCPRLIVQQGPNYFFIFGSKLLRSLCQGIIIVRVVRFSGVVWELKQILAKELLFSKYSISMNTLTDVLPLHLTISLLFLVEVCWNNFYHEWIYNLFLI